MKLNISSFTQKEVTRHIKLIENWNDMANSSPPDFTFDSRIDS